MSRGKRIMAIVLALLWAPVVSHCLLEPVLPSALRCASTEAAPHQTPDSTQDACGVVESGLYVVATAPCAPLPPEGITPLDQAWLLALRQAAQAEERHFELDRIPPELSAGWQFLLRAAPAPRAPSFLA